MHGPPEMASGEKWWLVPAWYEHTYGPRPRARAAKRQRLPPPRSTPGARRRRESRTLHAQPHRLPRAAASRIWANRVPRERKDELRLRVRPRAEQAGAWHHGADLQYRR